MTNPSSGAQAQAQAYALPYSPRDGNPIVVLQVDEHTALAVLPVRQFLELVPDPVQSEDAKYVTADPRLAAYGDLRKEVQRAVEGAKAKNALGYAKYIADGIAGEHPWVAPPVTLYHELPLKAVSFGPGVDALLVPFGDWLVAIDGETQRIAWQTAARLNPMVLEQQVPVVLHHGKPIDHARQGFYDLNTREVKPNIAVAISMDTRDPATQITRTLIDTSEVLRGRVHLRRRQLRRGDPEIVTISALRTAVVTTVLGVPGLQYGARPIALPGDVDIKTTEDAVLEVWTAILDQLEEYLDPERRDNIVVSAPAVLAGVGIVAHGTMPVPPRRQDVPGLSIDDVLERLEDINWEKTTTVISADGAEERKIFPWEGIAGKVTPAGAFSVGGPKEVAYAVAEAIGKPQSVGGVRIRAT